MVVLLARRGRRVPCSLPDQQPMTRTVLQLVGEGKKGKQGTAKDGDLNVEGGV